MYVTWWWRVPISVKYAILKLLGEMYYDAGEKINAISSNGGTLSILLPTWLLIFMQGDSNLSVFLRKRSVKSIFLSLFFSIYASQFHELHEFERHCIDVVPADNCTVRANLCGPAQH